MSESYATINGLNSATECLHQDLNSLQSMTDKQILELEKEKAASTSLRSTIEQQNEEFCKERVTADKRCKEQLELVKQTHDSEATTIGGWMYRAYINKIFI